MRTVLCVVGLALLLSLGCAQQAHRVRLVPLQPPTAEDYEEVLEAWTQSDKVYNLLDAVMFVSSTFHSPEFRQAFLLRHPNVYGRGSEQARTLALLDEGAEERLEFFISAYTADSRWNDLEKEDSIWRITLEGDDGEQVEGEVVRLKTNANLRVIYPYITDWAETYAVRFPRTNASGKLVISPRSESFTMRISSALGEAELRWALEPMVAAIAP